ncbi:MAG: LysE family transporter [Candidatus Omnitrophota bacterium]
MDLSILAKGVVIGFVLSAPVGPIGILCINRTLANGRLSGFVSGLGAVTADGLYCVVAAYGITLASDFLHAHQHWFRLAGGIFLLYLGAKIVLTKPAARFYLKNRRNLAADYVTAFLVTFTNPLMIVSFAAVFAALGLAGSRRDYVEASMLVTGVVAGAALCWLALCSWVGVFRNRLKANMLQVMRKTFGFIILALGVGMFL